ncbi:hypothetical protein GCM10011380_00410 [Sphingomonas metalli]|uniref:VRR-NUC domain-containing protein n=1 Tax=Sphingomonas metalli TaxID=1779358 RepID=A0A916WML1_9SPHN|nr:hypothetical protein [Sphingomonas metalli]GGB14918.1 hypothetical protein GCM10011380_00410 [Sphingomonas metalli]
MTLLAALDHLDMAVKPTPLFPVEPRDKRPASELSRQTAFLRLLRMQAPGVMAWAVPNAGKRGLKAQAQARSEGMTSGVFDVHVAWNHGTAALEFKSGTGTLSDNQVEWGNAMHERGHRVACVRTPEAALELLSHWGAPVRPVR